MGRLIDQVTISAEQGEVPPPRYFGRRGAKPLVGFEDAKHAPSVVVTEGLFDYLMLRSWGYSCVALVGTHVIHEVRAELETFNRVFLVLDQDEAGIDATLRLVEELQPAAVPVALPDGVKDVAELAVVGDGQRLFAETLLKACGGAVDLRAAIPLLRQRR